MNREERNINGLLNQVGPIDVEVNVRNDFEHGLQVLEAVGASRAADLREVTLNGCSTHGDERRHVRRWFARFVDLLDRHGREEGVRDVAFVGVGFDAGRRAGARGQQHIDGGGDNGNGGGGGDDGDDFHFAEVDQARLFGEVLPNLPRLERVRVYLCERYETYLKTFTSRLSATSALVELNINHYPGEESNSVPALADMIRRNEVPLQILM